LPLSAVSPPVSLFVADLAIVAGAVLAADERAHASTSRSASNTSAFQRPTALGRRRGTISPRTVPGRRRATAGATPHICTNWINALYEAPPYNIEDIPRTF
jgi:hypothetical protein